MRCVYSLQYDLFYLLCKEYMAVSACICACVCIHIVLDIVYNIIYFISCIAASVYTCIDFEALRKKRGKT